VLTGIESFRALVRYAQGPVSRLPAVLDQIDLTSFVTYDKCLLDAAQAAGLPVDAPA